MTKKHRTPYRNDALKVENGTVPSDIQEFVMKRALDYQVIDGVVIWNFNNHEVDEESLGEMTSNLKNDKYLIPFQASGVWAYMAHILPVWLREVEILTYSQTKGEYIPYPNYFRHSEESVNSRCRDDIHHELVDKLNGDDRVAGNVYL